MQALLIQQKLGQENGIAVGNELTQFACLIHCALTELPVLYVLEQKMRKLIKNKEVAMKQVD